MDMKDLRSKSPDELKSLYLETKKRLMSLRFKRVTDTLSDTSGFRKARRLMARLKFLGV